MASKVDYDNRGPAFTMGQVEACVHDLMVASTDVTSADLAIINAEEPARYWLSPPPELCDTCQLPIHHVFYDMKTTMGPWGCLCVACAMFGPGIGRTGPGLGQRYDRQPDGRWLKMEG
jgi:hypothetical protein